jgi:hypothetical protein
MKTELLILSIGFTLPGILLILAEGRMGLG